MVIIIPLSPSVGRYVETYFCTDKKMLHHLLLSLSCRHIIIKLTWHCSKYSECVHLFNLYNNPMR